LNYLVDRTRGFNLSRLLVYNIRVRLIAAASTGRAGQWTAQQNEHAAEESLEASEDPIEGIDQMSEDYQLKMRKKFVGRDPQPDNESTNYRKRSIADV
jgi:hypothetical protein